MLTKSLTLLAFALLMLSACGGESSSGSGASKALLEDDGVYKGSQNIVIFDSDGAQIDNQKLSFNMSVFQNQVANFETSFSINESIDEGSFNINSVPIAETKDGVTCNGTISYDGIIAAGSAQGSVRGEVVCRKVSERSKKFTIEGTFDGARGAISSKISIINHTQIDMTRVIKEVLNF